MNCVFCDVCDDISRAGTEANVITVLKAGVNEEMLRLPSALLDGATILLSAAVCPPIVFNRICTWLVFATVENNRFMKHWVCSTNKGHRRHCRLCQLGSGSSTCQVAVQP